MRTADTVADSKIAFAADPVAPEPDRRGRDATTRAAGPAPAAGGAQQGRDLRLSNAHAILTAGS